MHFEVQGPTNVNSRSQTADGINNEFVYSQVHATYSHTIYRARYMHRSMSFTQVSLKPSPGFCIKSATLEPGFLPPPVSPPTNESPQKKAVSSPGGLLEPTAQPIPVPKGMKVFVNICYDKHVPAPPEASEEAIQRAIKGAHPDESLDENGLKEGANITEKEEEEWYVPVVVSEPRVDKDKSGKPSLVVDCVYHSEVRKRTLRDSGFKVFLVGASWAYASYVLY